MLITDYEQIVEDYSRPTLVLAGPGSGKTYLLADRITRLLRKGLDKDTITVLTYTTDAHQNMVEKLTDALGDFRLSVDDLPHISTLHSLGLEILKENPRSVNLLKTNLRVQEKEEVKRLLYRDAALLMGCAEDDGEASRECKQEGDCRPDGGKKLCQICETYWDIMAKCNRVDFDDQILFACQILEGNDDILEKYQGRAKHLLVDEYQDINAAQYRLIELLSRRSRSGLFVVGDDAQSIYGFRGGHPKFILRFEEDFSGANSATLTKSRRCHKNVMDDGFSVLEKYYKEWTGRPDLEFLAKIGPKPFIYQVPSEISEAVLVAMIAKRALEEKNDVLVLAPKQDFFPLIMSQLSKRGIYPDCSISFLPPRIEIANRFLEWLDAPKDNFLTRLVIEDLINVGLAKVPGANKRMLKSQKSLENRIAAEREIAKLWECVDKKTDLYSAIRAMENCGGVMGRIQKGLSELVRDFQEYKDRPGDFAKQLAMATGIWTDPAKLSEDISEIVDLLDHHTVPVTGTVQLRTLRKAKGLEASVVIIVGLENDIIPNRNSDISEEARLFYVSVTRAKKELYLIHSYKRPRSFSFGQSWEDKPRSEFLDVIGRKSEWKKVFK